MKLLTRQQFMALPPGAICCEGTPWAFGSWFRKDGNCCDTDYFKTDLDWSQYDHNSSEDLIDKADAAAKSGDSLRLIFDGCGRDGCFRDDSVYWVLENDDIDAFISVLADGKNRI